MSQPDLSGVDPVRRPEVLRRIRHLKAYLDLPNPTAVDTLSHAQALGLGRSQFYRLVRSWRDHRRPALLIGSGVAGSQPRLRDYGVDAKAREIAAQVIGTADTESDLAVIAPLIETKCEAVGVRPPSRPTIWTYLMKARSAGDAVVAGPPRIVIGRMWFRLPLAVDEPGLMPVMLGAFLLPERLVVAEVVSVTSDTPPSVFDLMNDLLARRTESAPLRPLAMARGDQVLAAAAMGACGMAMPRERTRSVQRALSGAFGSRFGSLPIVYHRSMARPSQRPAPRRLEAGLTRDEAVAAVMEAVGSNNARRLPFGVPPPFDVATSAID